MVSSQKQQNWNLDLQLSLQSKKDLEQIIEWIKAYVGAERAGTFVLWIFILSYCEHLVKSKKNLNNQLFNKLQMNSIFLFIHDTIHFVVAHVLML